MITAKNIKALSVNNYIRKASHRNNYWLDISEGPIKSYLKKSHDFSIIIYSELNSPNYYVIPYSALKGILIKNNLSKGRKRWVGTIQNNILKITNSPLTVDLTAYYSKQLDESSDELLHVVKEDIESYKSESNSRFEGAKKPRLINYYERNPQLRADAIKIHGTKCIGCQFDFQKTYGLHGKDYIEVHHLKPIASLIESTLIDPKTDMTVVCSNCHRMIHRKKNNPLSIEELVYLLSVKRIG